MCIVPPNSFALARSVEYFRIPRNVLTICVGKIHLRALRHHHQRDAVRARVGGPRHPRDQQHHAAAGQDLRQRGHLPGPVLRGGRRRRLRDQLQGQGRKVSAQTGVTLPSCNRAREPEPDSLSMRSYSRLSSLRCPRPRYSAQHSATPGPPGRVALSAGSIFPPPTLIRTGAGSPGPRLLATAGGLHINATLDTVAKAVVGDERITYTNNSPDTLRYLWLQLDQNLYATGSRGTALSPGTPPTAGSGSCGSASRRSLRPRGEPPGQRPPLPYSVNNTMMRVELPRPLPPKGRQLLAISWTFPFGPDRNRMGIEAVDGSTIFEVAAVVSSARRCTTMCAAGTPSSIWATASSTWSTAAST